MGGAPTSNTCELGCRLHLATKCRQPNRCTHALWAALVVAVAVSGVNGACDFSVDRSGQAVVPPSFTAIPLGNISGNTSISSCQPPIVTISLPDTLTTIRGFGFAFSNLTELTIPDSVFAMGPGALFGSHALQRLEIGDAVATLPTQFCTQCRALTDLTLPSTLMSIAESAFSHCTALRSLIVPNSVTNLGTATFLGCQSLRTLVLPPTLGRIPNNMCFQCSSLATFSFPNAVTAIGPGALRGTSLRTVIFPLGVSVVAQSLFQSCTALTSVVLHDAVLTIGAGAFFQTTALVSVAIPDSVNQIHNFAFGSSGVATITIPSTTTINSGAFSNCPCTESLYVSGTRICACVPGTCSPSVAPTTASPASAGSPTQEPIPPPPPPQTQPPTSFPTSVVTSVPSTLSPAAVATTASPSTPIPIAVSTGSPTSLPSSAPTASTSAAPTATPTALLAPTASTSSASPTDPPTPLPTPLNSGAAEGGGSGSGTSTTAIIVGVVVAVIVIYNVVALWFRRRRQRSAPPKRDADITTNPVFAADTAIARTPHPATTPAPPDNTVARRSGNPAPRADGVAASVYAIPMEGDDSVYYASGPLPHSTPVYGQLEPPNGGRSTQSTGYAALGENRRGGSGAPQYASVSTAYGAPPAATVGTEYAALNRGRNGSPADAGTSAAC